MTRRARVLSVVDSLGPGGAERHVVNLCRGLRDGPFPSDLFAMHGRGAVYLEDVRKSGVGLFVGGRSPRSLAASCVRLRRTLAAGRYDVVHAYLPVSTLVAAPLARWCGVPRVVTTVVARREQMARGPFGFDNYRRLARWIDLYLTPYPRQLLELGGIAPSRIRFARLALDVAGDPSDGAEAPPPWFARLDGAFPVVVGVGRLHPDKGHDMAIRAFAIVRSRRPAAKLVVMGLGPELAALQDVARQCGVEEHVIFGGFLKDLAPLLRRAHAYVKTSINEGANMAMMHAMGGGVPCVAFETGDMEYEGPDFKQCAVFAALRDVEALAAGVESVLADAVLRERVTSEASRFVRERDPLAVVRDVENAYEACLAAERS